MECCNGLITEELNEIINQYINKYLFITLRVQHPTALVLIILSRCTL